MSFETGTGVVDTVSVIDVQEYGVVEAIYRLLTDVRSSQCAFLDDPEQFSIAQQRSIFDSLPVHEKQWYLKTYHNHGRSDFFVDTSHLAEPVKPMSFKDANNHSGARWLGPTKKMLKEVFTLVKEEPKTGWEYFKANAAGVALSLLRLIAVTSGHGPDKGHFPGTEFDKSVGLPYTGDILLFPQNTTMAGEVQAPFLENKQETGQKSVEVKTTLDSHFHSMIADLTKLDAKQFGFTQSEIKYLKILATTNDFAVEDMANLTTIFSKYAEKMGVTQDLKDFIDEMHRLEKELITLHGAGNSFALQIHQGIASIEASISKVSYESSRIKPTSDLANFYTARVADNPTRKNQKQDLTEMSEHQIRKVKQQAKVDRADARSGAAGELSEIQKMFLLDRAMELLTTTKMGDGKNKMTPEQASTHINKNFIALWNLVCDGEANTADKIHGDSITELVNKLDVANGGEGKKDDSPLYKARRSALSLHGANLEDLMIYGPEKYLARQYANQLKEQEALKTRKTELETRQTELETRQTAFDATATKEQKDLVTAKIASIKKAIEEKTGPLAPQDWKAMQGEIEGSFFTNVMVSNIEGAEGVNVSESKIFRLNKGFLQKWLADAVVVTVGAGKGLGDKSAMGTNFGLSIGTMKVLGFGEENTSSGARRRQINYGTMAGANYNLATGKMQAGLGATAGVTLRINDMRNGETDNLNAGPLNGNRTVSLRGSATKTPEFPVYAAGVTINFDRLGALSETAGQYARQIDEDLQAIIILPAHNKDSIYSELKKRYPKTKDAELQIITKTYIQVMQSYDSVQAKLSKDQKTDLRKRLGTHLVMDRYHNHLDKIKGPALTGVMGGAIFIPQLFTVLPIGMPLLTIYKSPRRSADPSSQRQAEHDLKVGQGAESTGERLVEGIDGLNIRLGIENENNKIQVLKEKTTEGNTLVAFPLTTLSKVNIYLQGDLLTAQNGNFGYQYVTIGGEPHLVVPADINVYETKTATDRGSVTNLYLGGFPGQVSTDATKVVASRVTPTEVVNTAQMDGYIAEVTKEFAYLDAGQYENALKAKIDTMYANIDIFDKSGEWVTVKMDEPNAGISLKLKSDIVANIREPLPTGVSIDQKGYLKLPLSGHFEIQKSKDLDMKNSVNVAKNILILYAIDSTANAKHPQLKMSGDPDVATFKDKQVPVQTHSIDASKVSPDLKIFLSSKEAGPVFMAWRIKPDGKHNPDHDVYYRAIDTGYYATAKSLVNKYFTVDGTSILPTGVVLDEKTAEGQANLRYIYGALSRVPRTEAKHLLLANATPWVDGLLTQAISKYPTLNKDSLKTLATEILTNHNFQEKELELLRLLAAVGITKTELEQNSVMFENLSTAERNNYATRFNPLYRLYFTLADAHKVADLRTGEVGKGGYKGRMAAELEYKNNPDARDDLFHIRDECLHTPNMKRSLHSGLDEDNETVVDSETGEGGIGIVAAYEGAGTEKNQMTEKFVYNPNIIRHSNKDIPATGHGQVHRKYFLRNLDLYDHSSLDRITVAFKDQLITAGETDVTRLDNHANLIHLLTTQELPKDVDCKSFASIDAPFFSAIFPECINEVIVMKPPQLFLNRSEAQKPTMSANPEQVVRTHQQPDSKIFVNTVVVENQAVRNSAMPLNIGAIGGKVPEPVTEKLIDAGSNPDNGNTGTVVHEVTTVTGNDGNTYDGFKGILTVNNVKWTGTFYIDRAGQLVANIPGVNNNLGYYTLTNFPVNMNAQLAMQQEQIRAAMLRYIVREKPKKGATINYDNLQPYLDKTVK